MRDKKMTKKMKAVLILGLAAILIVAGGITVAAHTANSSNDSNIVYKETTVGQGNIVAGVTESGSVSLGTVTQDYDFDSVTSSNSASTTTTSSNSSSQSNGGNSASTNASSGAGFSNVVESNATTASTGNTSSTTSSANLEVEEVYVTAGTTVNEGDPLLKITEESISNYREQLEDSLSDAKLALTQANLNAKSDNLNAQYTYDTNIANGNVAQSVYDNTIAQLQNAVTSAQQELDSSASKISGYQSQIAAGVDMSAALAQEQINYSTLQSKLASAQNDLATKSVSAKQEYDEAMLNYKNASSLKSIDTAGTTQTVSDAKEDVSDAQDALDTFNSFIGDGIVYSEYTGTLISIGYEAGDTLSSTTNIATFADASAVTMSVSVSEEDITAVSVGDMVDIKLNAYEDEEFEGQVKSIDTSASSGSSTVDYTVIVVFTGDVSKIYADMTGDVTFVTKEVDNVVYVSDKAVICQGTKSYVDIKDDNGNIQRVEVACGFSNGENVEIQSGLTVGQTALIESQVNAE